MRQSHCACMGFPRHPYGWRNFAPRLAASGWRVVAPFMRGYAPSSIPSDGSYHIGALMHDALQGVCRGRRHRPRRGDRSRLGRDGGQRPGRDPGQSIRQSRDDVACHRLRRFGDGFATPAGCWRRSHLSCCAAGTSCTSNCLGCQSVRRPGCCRGCGSDGRRVTTPRRTCVTSTPRSARRRAGAPRSGPDPGTNRNTRPPAYAAP